ncbi:MerR family transcriptional regulator [Tepidibacter mesophilus]|uniref:MerR family transcriptional regulator n=1 Tax=Tepidibacter mesophilus TaxID=655607 RepID=UPI000C07AAE4|nr:MerR family transcriptional regulator [Tepidibacter mesophilus]
MTIDSTNINYNNLNNSLYTTKQAARIMNISQSTLRKYEEKYNIHIQRNEKGHRKYSVEDINKFQEILNLKNIKKNKNEISLGNTNKYNESFKTAIKDSIANDSYISLEAQNNMMQNFEKYIKNFTNDLFQNNNHILLNDFKSSLDDKVDKQIDRLVDLIKLENNQLRSENKRLMNMIYELNSKIELLIQKEEPKDKPMKFNRLFSKNK